MRFVPTFCLREGMILGDNLFGGNSELILARNTILTKDFIFRIRELNYNGIYVEDTISKNIVIETIINDRIRNQTVKGIRDFYTCMEYNTPIPEKKINTMQNQIESIVDEILKNKNMMLNMVDLKVFDNYTYFHSVNVAVLSIVIGSSINLDHSELCDLGFAALLHDIGKVFINKNILNKNGKLTPDEFDQMKKHSELGCAYLKKSFGLPTSLEKGIIDHHEKFGGGGYPNNLIGDEISLFGRIISIADVYDALTSDRPYRKAVHPSEVIEYIMGATNSLFDPTLIQTFIEKIAPYPIGTIVLLSNELTGIVTKNFKGYCLRPNIRIFKQGKLDVLPSEITLKDTPYLNITIKEVLINY